MACGAHNMNMEQKWEAAAATSKNGAPVIFSDVLYDKIAYAAVGQAGVLNFFKVPIGAGATLYGVGPKTLADTNMDQAGILSAGEAFLADFLSFRFISGAKIMQDVVSAVAPVALASPAEDEDTFWRKSGGFFEFKYLSKRLASGDVFRAPPPVRMSFAAVASVISDVAAVTEQVEGSTAVPVGHLWQLLHPGVRFDASTKFSLTMGWNAAVPMPSGLAGVIVAEFNGSRMERSQ